MAKSVGGSADRPLIGVVGGLEPGERRRLVLPTRYLDAVLKAGGLAVGVASIGGPGDVTRILERLDGLLFAGADDFDTARLGLGPTHPKATPVAREKQDFDLELARAALARGKPVLGVCYGMQLLGLAEGARLHQHLPDDRPGAQEHAGGVHHPVQVDPGSRLFRLLEVSQLDTVSRHHQALARVEPPWRVAARDDQGLIEAIERDGHPFAIGVQWHPELSGEGSEHDRLFRGLVGASAFGGRRGASALAARRA